MIGSPSSSPEMERMSRPLALPAGGVATNESGWERPEISQYRLWRRGEEEATRKKLWENPLSKKGTHTRLALSFFRIRSETFITHLTYDIQLLFTILLYVRQMSTLLLLSLTHFNLIPFSAQHETAHHRLRSRRGVALGGCERSGTIFLVSEKMLDRLDWN